MRTRFAIKNIRINIFSQIILIVLGFISRKVFIDSLGLEYLGVNGLLTNVLSAMVLIEGGLGASITYNLYKPLAEKDESTVIALVKLYKKCYMILAGIIFIVCLCIFPFINKIIDNNIYGVGVVYWIFVIKNIVSYLNAYKWTVINADQRGFLLAKNNLVFQVLSMIAKIIIVIITNNYILYLIIELLIFMIQNIYNTTIINKRYSYIKTREKYEIENKIKNNIIKNVKAMFIQNIGNYAIFSTDNLIISIFVSVKSVGLYSNYNMLIGQVSNLLSTFLGGIGNSVGNLIAIEENNKIYDVFRISNFVAFWIYSFSTICLYILTEPFIEWWLGKDNLLGKSVLIIVLVNFYISGMRGIVNMFKSKGGLFGQDKYAPVVEGIINVILSIILVKYLGIAGVFLGTTISFLTLSYWNQPRIIYKYLFQKPVKEYFIDYIKKIILMLLIGSLVFYIGKTINIQNIFLNMLLQGVLATIIINTIYLFIFRNTKEFKYLINIFIKRENKLKLGKLKLKLK